MRGNKKKITKPSPLHIDNDSSAVNLSTFSSLVCVGHVFFSFELNEGIATGFPFVVKHNFDSFDGTVLFKFSSELLLCCFISQSGNKQGVVGIAKEKQEDKMTR
jgi:hypothetical protein